MSKIVPEFADAIFRKGEGMTESVETHERVFQHRGAKRKDLIAAVKAEEALAAEKLGGPVKRSHEFQDRNGDKCKFIWRLA